MTLSKKQTKIAFGILMAFFMALGMSFVMVWVNVGLTPHFLMIWMKSFAIGFMAAVPISMIAGPLVQRIVSKISSHG